MKFYEEMDHPRAFRGRFSNGRQVLIAGGMHGHTVYANHNCTISFEDERLKVALSDGKVLLVTSNRTILPEGICADVYEMNGYVLYQFDAYDLTIKVKPAGTPSILTFGHVHFAIRPRPGVVKI
tara:strand:+ start:179976 stop:180347 length:372 start_codon:yes stop_codon:yes gene_type:complete